MQKQISLCVAIDGNYTLTDAETAHIMLYTLMATIGAQWVSCGVWHWRGLVIESDDGVHVTVTQRA